MHFGDKIFIKSEGTDIIYKCLLIEFVKETRQFGGNFVNAN